MTDNELRAKGLKLAIAEASARDAEKITDKELLVLARLVCFRIWREQLVKE